MLIHYRDLKDLDDETEAEAKKRKKEGKSKKEALTRMVNDLGESLGDTNEHLDLDLEDEKGLIEKYSRLLKMEQ